MRRTKIKPIKLTPLQIRHRKQKWKKYSVTALLFLSFTILGCYKSLPGVVMEIINETLAVGMRTQEYLVVFEYLSLGYIVGCFLSLNFDVLKSGTQREIIFICVLILAAVTALSLPFGNSESNLSVIFFVTGISMATLDIGFSVYFLDIWKKESYTYFQVLHFFFSLGYLLGPVLTRFYIKQVDVSIPKDNTTDVWKKAEDANCPLYQYTSVILGCLFLVLTLLWVGTMLWPNIRISLKRNHNVVKSSTRSFHKFAIITSFVLFYCIGSLIFGYPHLLAAFTVSVYKFTAYKAAEVVVTFWSAHIIGAVFVVFMAQTFHPFSIILLQLMLILSGGIVILYFARNSFFNLSLGHAIVGFGSASLLPTTILWLETYVNIAHKEMAVFLIGMTMGKMTIMRIILVLMGLEHEGLAGLVFAMPILYILIFISQSVIFILHGEKRITTEIYTLASRRLFPLFLHNPQKVVGKTAYTQTGELKKVKSDQILTTRGHSTKGLRPLGGKALKPAKFNIEDIDFKKFKHADKTGSPASTDDERPGRLKGIMENKPGRDNSIIISERQVRRFFRRKHRTKIDKKSKNLLPKLDERDESSDSQMEFKAGKDDDDSRHSSVDEGNVNLKSSETSHEPAAAQRNVSAKDGGKIDENSKNINSKGNEPNEAREKEKTTNNDEHTDNLKTKERPVEKAENPKTEKDKSNEGEKDKPEEKMSFFSRRRKPN